MFKFFALTTLVTLMACEQQKTIEEMSYAEVRALAVELREKCRAAGATEGAAFEACAKQEAQRERLSRQNAQVRRANAYTALAAGMQQTSNNYYAASARTASAVPRTLTCTSAPAPTGMVRANCY